MKNKYVNELNKISVLMNRNTYDKKTKHVAAIKGLWL